jgi:hypothetical protein
MPAASLAFAYSGAGPQLAVSKSYLPFGHGRRIHVRDLRPNPSGFGPD